MRDSVAELAGPDTAEGGPVEALEIDVVEVASARSEAQFTPVVTPQSFAHVTPTPPEPPPKSERTRSAEQLRRAKQLLRPFDVIGDYQILKVLGAGGMAEVYLARAMLGEGVDKLVALKTVLPEFGEDTRYGALFLQEAQVSAKLRHPNMVQVFACGEAAGRAYLAMEYFHGRDLTAALKALRQRGEPARPAIAVAVARELCRALQYVHGRNDLDGRPLNLVHRDVSPGNVLLTPDAEVKLMDFGVAAAAGQSSGEGLLVGKFPYMTVAQATGGKPSPHWDLFAVGMILYELLTLRRPYPKVPLTQFVAMRQRGEFPPPSTFNPDVPPELDMLVSLACDERTAFQSAAQFGASLEALQARLGHEDLGAWIRELFGPELAAEQREVEALTSSARARTGFQRSGHASPLRRKLRAVRRRIAATRGWMALSQRPWLRRGAIAVVLLCAAAASAGLGLNAKKERELLRHLQAADAQAASGRLVGPTGTEMLGELLEAKALKPADPRVARRLSMLADTFERLGTVALSRGNPEEAAAHLEAALKADPSREQLRQKLQQIEQQMISTSKARIVRAQ